MEPPAAERSPHGPKATPLAVIAALFVVSGAAGLVDQICFSKYLSYVVGSTAHAVSAVLAAFMTGMAFGAYLGGRWAARVVDPLRAYGKLEVLVGLSVALAPFAFQALEPAYVALVRGLAGSPTLVTGLRWLSAVLVVVVPTTAMGATLPLLSRLIEGSRAGGSRGRALGVLYAANTLGGALGSVGAAYVVLPRLGLSTATFAAALTSVGVGAVAMVLGRGQVVATVTDEPARQPGAGSSGDRVVLDAIAFASGALVFACEVLFVHLLVLLVGTSAYAFGVILSIFLVCLFVGAGLAPILHRSLGPGALALGLGLAALALTGTMGIWEALPDYFRGMGDKFQSFEGRELVRGSAALFALALPTTLMGLTFPLLLQSIADRPGVGRLVGRLTSVNTLGAVAGSLAAGYWILPMLGSQRSIFAVACGFSLAAITVLATTRHAGAKRLVLRIGAGAFAAAGVIVGLTAHPWDLARMTGGYNVYFDWGRGEEDIVFVSEDTQGGVTTVTEKNGVKTLLTNGKFQGNDGEEMHAQRSFAHYPALFVTRFDRAMVVGLGTGTTLGTVAAYPFQKVDVAEISPAIVHAARTYFPGVVRAALADPRVTLFMEDGRNHLLVSDQTYDLVGIELTSVWFAGAGSLYSREFYALVKRRLAPFGVLQQWIQLHHIYPRDLATVVHTLRLEFAHVALFYGGGQGILVASNERLSASRQRADALEEGLGEIRPSRPLKSLIADVLLTTEGLDAFVAEVAREEGVPLESLVSTDDNLYLEYATPRGNVLPWSSREDMVRRLVAHREGQRVLELMGE